VREKLVQGSGIADHLLLGSLIGGTCRFINARPG